MRQKGATCSCPSCFGAQCWRNCSQGSSPSTEFLNPLLTPLQELSNLTRPDNTAGMSLVGLGAALGLWWLFRQA